MPAYAIMFFAVPGPNRGTTLHFVIILLSLLQPVTVFFFLLFFMILTALKSIGQAFCELLCNLGLYDVFSPDLTRMINLGE